MVLVCWWWSRAVPPDDPPPDPQQSSLLLSRFDAHTRRLAAYYSYTLKEGSPPLTCLGAKLQDGNNRAAFCIGPEAQEVVRYESAPSGSTVLSDIVIKDALIADHPWSALTELETLRAHLVRTSSYWGIARFASYFDFSRTNVEAFEAGRAPPHRRRDRAGSLRRRRSAPLLEM